jgi:hypothetical protein
VRRYPFAMKSGGTELIVNALNEISYLPVELFRGLHKGHVSTMIVIDARGMRDMASNKVRVDGKTIRSFFPWIINDGTLIGSNTALLSNVRLSMPSRAAG